MRAVVCVCAFGAKTRALCVKPTHIMGRNKNNRNSKQGRKKSQIKKAHGRANNDRFGHGQKSKWGLNKNVLKASAGEGAAAEHSRPGAAPRAGAGGAGAGRSGSQSKKKLTKLQAMMQSKMESAKFRWLNEKL